MKAIAIIFILLSNNLRNAHNMETNVDVVSGRSSGIIYLYESADGKYWLKCNADSLVLHGVSHETKKWNVPINRTIHYKYVFKSNGFDLRLKTFLY